ncbi:Pentatricopeptide repeat [Macleaya cordata]|uniref:Pentatricopeptide repeat n=1 Tax=Macleaya cordata TaxID=56857 RepID=A0A200PMC0_MACCD|nr:Pentatricopeptide repeat [Macleaya cordata]
MKDLKQIHARKIKTGRIRDPFAAAEILRFCALTDHYKDLEYARLVFDQIEEPNCFSFNTIIRAFSETNDQLIESLIIFNQMLYNEYVQPNNFTFPSVLKTCAKMGRIEEGKQVHGQIIKRGLGLDLDEFIVSNLVRMYLICGVMNDARKLFDKSAVRSSDLVGDGNVVLWNVMIDGYIRIGNFAAARELFDLMPKRSVVSWNGMIAGYAQNEFFREALEIFRKMQLENVSPNYVTLVSVLPAISRLGALELGKWVHLYAEKHKIEVDDVLGSALIDMYSKCGSIEKAIQVFERLPRRNAVTWNAIIGGLAMHGQAKDALDYFIKMEQGGVRPTDVCYISVLSACSHAGLVDKGRSYFEQMVRVVGLKPRIEHYGCMVDLLGRAGLLEEAEEIILNMPIKPDDVIWKALLGACKMHGNVEMGKRVAKRLMELAPSDSGSYVALSNLFASLGDWEGVAEVRLMMKEKDVRKDPGCSWIELDGTIHEFFVEDESHPRAREIHLMLEEMADQLRLVGYTPDTSQVLLNMDEEEKENTLYYHSEKIAISFGLISTKSHTPLRIVKNLRICGDCHSSIKLISRIYNRRIIVRDRNRFHHFENGFCSCMDYW